MENKQKTAFPIVEAKYSGIHQGFENICTEQGMSKRFYAACAAMQGILSNTNLIDSLTADRRIWVVQRAFMLADELLKQEQL